MNRYTSRATAGIGPFTSKPEISEEPQDCFECSARIPERKMYYHFVSVTQQWEIDICARCKRDWDVVNHAERIRRGTKHHPKNHLGQLHKRVLNAESEKILVSDTELKTLLRWRVLTPLVQEAKNEFCIASEPAPEPTHVAAKSAPKEPVTQVPPVPKVVVAVVPLDRDMQRRKALDMTIRELIVQFENDVLDPQATRNSLMRFNTSEAQKQMCVRWRTALPLIVEHLETHKPLNCEVLSAWGRLLCRMQMTLDLDNQEAPEEFMDISGWITWAKSMLSKLPSMESSHL